MRISRVMAAAAFIALSFSATARAANLIVNSDFPADVTTGWTSLGTVVWDSVHGSPAAGSAHITATENVGGPLARSFLGQCVAIAYPNNFDFIVRTVINSSSGTALSQARVFFFSGSSCAGTQLPLFFADTLNPVGDGWTERSLVNTPLPATTVSALVELYADAATGNMDINFDDVRFGIAGTTAAVELQSFTAE
jgi:hypothetical protein